MTLPFGEGLRVRSEKKIVLNKLMVLEQKKEIFFCQLFFSTLFQ